MTWISVTERMPKKLHKVLFHWVCPDGNKNISMGFLCDAGWDIYLPYNSYGLSQDVCPVTHWMEVPDFPYEEPIKGTVFIDESIVPIAEGTELAHKRVLEFAEKFIESNKDLLKRLADR